MPRVWPEIFTARALRSDRGVFATLAAVADADAAAGRFDERALDRRSTAFA